MIQNQETNNTITTTHRELTQINHELTKYLEALYKSKSFSLTEPDRKIIREIRDKNLETLQLIDMMSYKWEVELE